MSQTSKYAKYIHVTFNGNMEATDYIHHVSSLNITTVFPLTSPILIPFSGHRKDSGTRN